MDRFYLKNGKEVHLGETIYKLDNVNTIFGKVKSTQYISVTASTLPSLIKLGIITVKKDDDKSKSSVNKDDKIRMNLNYYLDKLAEKISWETILKMYDIYPAALLSLALREIAIELDNLYSDHIKNSPEIYVISMIDGRITKVNKACIKNYRNFAAFRSVNDAKIACKITRDILKKMFKGE